MNAEHVGILYIFFGFFFFKYKAVLKVNVYLKIHLLSQLENEVTHVNALHNVLHITDVIQ